MNKNKPIGARSILASRIDDGVNSRFVLGTAAMLLVILLPSLDRRVKINIYEVISLASQSIPDRGSPRMHISIKDDCICREKERILIVSRLEFREDLFSFSFWLRGNGFFPFLICAHFRADEMSWGKIIRFPRKTQTTELRWRKW